MSKTRITAPSRHDQARSHVAAGPIAARISSWPARRENIWRSQRAPAPRATKPHPAPLFPLIRDRLPEAGTAGHGALESAALQRQTSSSDPERERARQELERAQQVLQGLQARLKQLLNAGDTGEAQRLATDIVSIRLEVERLAEIVDRGSSRQTAMATIGGGLALGLAIPAPEEVITWPIAGLAALGVLIFTAAAASKDEIGAATRALTRTLTDALTRPRRASGCRLRPLGYHRGGDPIHDACADGVPPNMFPGSDIEVTAPPLGTKSFDALSPRRELWEVKTERYSNYPPFIQEQTLNANIADIATELPIATRCGYPYVFAVSDPEQFAALGPRVPPGVSLRLVSC